MRSGRLDGVSRGISLAEDDALVRPTPAASNSGTLVVADGDSYDLTGTMTNSGTIELESSGDDTDLIITTPTVTLTGGGTIILSDNAGNRIYTSEAAATLVNVNNLIEGSGEIGDGTALTIVNQGTIDATGANGLVLSAPLITNTGLIESTSSGGTVLQSATIANAAGTILAAAGGAVYLEGADIQGGTLKTAGSGFLGILGEESATLDGSAHAVVNTGTFVVENQGSPTVLGTLTNSGTIELESSNQATDFIVGGGTVTLNGGGKLILSDNAGNRIYTDASAATLVNVNNLIEGSGEIGDGTALTIVNQGTIDATGANGLVLSAPLITNTGLIESTSSGGTVLQSATIANAAGTILAAAGGAVYLEGADIQGGTLKTAGSGFLGILGEESATLDGSAHAVVNTGTFVVENQGSPTVLGTLTNSGTIELESSNQATDFIVGGGTVTLNGGGKLILSDNAGNRIYTDASAATLVNVNNLIEGSGEIGDGTALTIVNQGTIDATGANGLVLSAPLITNTGLIESTSSGGTVLQSATIANAAGTILAAAGGAVYLEGADIQGGTLKTAGSGFLGILGEESATLDGSAHAVVNTGTFVVENQGSPTVLGTLTNSGTIELESSNQATDLIVGGGTVTLNGGGKLILSDNAGNRIYTDASAATLVNVNNLIEGSGEIGDGTALTIVNQGTIDATGANGLVLSAPLITNTGLIESTSSGGTVLQSATIANAAGTILAAAGGAVYLEDADIQGGSIATGATGLVVVADSTTLDGSVHPIVIGGNGTLDIQSDQILTLSGSVSNTGVILSTGSLVDAGIFTDSGLIESAYGASGTALSLAGPADSLILAPGAGFVGTVAGSGGTLDLAGASGTLSGLGTSLSGFAKVDVLAGANWRLTATGTIASGTTSSLIDAGILTLLGNSVITGTASGTGSLVVGGGGTALEPGMSLTVAHLTVSAGTAVLGANLVYRGSFSESGGTLSLTTHNAELTGACVFSGGTVAGTAYLQTLGAVSLSSLVLDGGAVWQVFGTVMETGGLVLGNSGGGTGRVVTGLSSAFDITGNGGIMIAAGGSGSIANQGLFEKTGGTGSSTIAAAITDTGKIVASTGTLDFTGAVNSFAGAIGGTGAFELGGGKSTIATGTLLGVSAVSLQGTGTMLTLAGNLSYDGSLSDGAGTTLALGANLLSLAGTSTLAGTVSGTGTLALTGGTTALVAGTSLTVAHLTVSAGTAVLSANLVYRGSFSESGGTLSLTTHNAELTGACVFSGGTVAGTAYLQTLGAVSLSSLVLDGGAVWQVFGTVMETGGLVLGNSGGGTGRVVTGLSSAFDITGNGGIMIAAGGSGSITNQGLFEKTGGTGSSTIAAAIANNGGTIAVNAGTLDIAGAVTYSGQETIGASGTLKFDSAVSTGQTIGFAGTTGGALVLNDPSGGSIGFAGTISGFGGSDTLDLVTFAFVPGSKPDWTQNGAGGALSIIEGSKMAKIMLFGQYAAAGFSAAKDAAGDTLITYTAPEQMAALAAPHR